ncbi:unnamed protein product [Notodromas monacha]|uniref:Ig-like domain-containing protein n=1 Tax=Notodromas monacha TaxID=399045 RepID=A0A7R9BBT0_9CRUS|nr:unnamed protein product [Notodromas monacha]CAG0912294.1 unnamed protein product [Notodromas monacha]
MLCATTELGSFLFVGSAQDVDGPFFIREPPNQVDFSNSTGAVIECAARGSPHPEVTWVKQDGTVIGEVQGLRQVSMLTSQKPLAAGLA